MGRKVAIISINFNRGTEIIDSIESILAQSYQDFHLYIVDDVSSDDTFEKASERVRGIENVTLLKNEINKGFTRSLIHTIAMLDNEYIAINGAGDISLPGRIYEQVEFLDQNPEAGVVCVGVANRAVNNVSDKIYEITTADLLRRNMINHGTAMFRLDVYRKVGGYREYFKFRQDKDLWYRMSLLTKLYFLPQKLYRWTNSTNSVSSNHGFSPLPSLMSFYATYLIKERLRSGHDSLDKYGEYAGLLFNPTYASMHISKNIVRLVLSGKPRQAEGQLSTLLAISRNRLVRLICRILLPIVRVRNQGSKGA